MSTPQWIRRTQRWLAVVFTLGVVINFITWTSGYRERWVSFLVLVPIACLMVSGLCMLIAPYLAKRHSAGGQPA
jgi:intracellular septation protein A